MLIDLLADSLPNPKKGRYHFTTFVLETLARLEHFRNSRSRSDSEYSLLWLAKDMIEKSPILFLDEFQLPDRASNKILSNLLTAFFQLGGVLIASSNRMPDELAKASGVHFTARPRGGLVRDWLGSGNGQGKSDLQADNEYAGFVEILKARCDIIDILGTRDWRRQEVDEMEVEAPGNSETLREYKIGESIEPERAISGNSDLGYQQNQLIGAADGTMIGVTEDVSKLIMAETPKKYLLTAADNGMNWKTVIHLALPDVSDPIPWQSTNFLVYGRRVPVSRHIAGVTFWTFNELCGANFGPADYFTLASTFHTLILDEVPVLGLSQKNEARRFITLLDALYESRCKLVIRAETGPDNLFFPETKVTSIHPEVNGTQRSGQDGSDAVYSETLSEIYQDQVSPFRPSVSLYAADPNTGYDPDQDSAFDPVPEKGNEVDRGVDFGMTSGFTGEDEKFAYKRATSRLWEMCSARWHARSEPGWWKPLPLEVRRWEHASSVNGDVEPEGSPVVDRPVEQSGEEFDEGGKRDTEPFDGMHERPPKISWTHAWGMMKWGEKAGPWGQGSDGLSQKKGSTKDR
jgi:peroxisome-assembly ATPase